MLNLILAVVISLMAVSCTRTATVCPQKPQAPVKEEKKIDPKKLRGLFKDMRKIPTRVKVPEETKTVTVAEF